MTEGVEVGVGVGVGMAVGVGVWVEVRGEVKEGMTIEKEKGVAAAGVASVRVALLQAIIQSSLAVIFAE